MTFRESRFLDMAPRKLWFHALLEHHVAAAGGQSAFAKKVGVTKSLVNSWLAGGNAKAMTQVENLLAALGGDITRACFVRPRKANETAA